MAGLSFSLVIKTRSGSGSLQFTMAGSGNRLSSLIFGGITDVLGLVTGRRLNRPGWDGTSTFGANWCCLLAYDSRRFSGPRGGSIGTKLNVVIWEVISPSIFRLTRMEGGKACQEV